MALARAFALGIGLCDVKRVARCAVAGEFGQHCGAASAGVFILFQDHDAGAFAEYEPITAGVERPARRPSGHRCASKGPCRR